MNKCYRNDCYKSILEQYLCFCAKRSFQLKRKVLHLWIILTFTSTTISDTIDGIIMHQRKFK